MGDDGGNARSVRGSGEEAAEDLSSVASAADAESADDRIGDREVPKWMRPGMWGGGIVGVLLLYFMAYPQIVLRMDDWGVFDNWPEWAIDSLVISIEPIMYMAERVPFYAKLAGVSHFL